MADRRVAPVMWNTIPMTAHSTDTILTEVRDGTGTITLNRPKALNSLDHTMIRAIDAAVRQWAEDDRVERVVVRSSSKHFCSGGDVKMARAEILAGNAELVDEFFAHEYAMNLFIAQYPKPFTALAGGVIMGGGMGISAIGGPLVVADNAFASMPEMNIGYITDVGMSWKLQHLPGRGSVNLGKFLGLTGYRMTPDDMLALGLASKKIAAGEELSLADAPLEPQPSPLARWFDDIEATFAGSWADIDRRLDAQPGEFAELVRDLTKQASPSSLVATAELFEANANQDLAGALDNERRLGELMRREPDFAEGVRAVLVDKDQAPEFAPQPDPDKYRAVLNF